MNTNLSLYPYSSLCNQLCRVTIRLLACLAYMDVGKGREQDAEALNMNINPALFNFCSLGIYMNLRFIHLCILIITLLFHHHSYAAHQSDAKKHVLLLNAYSPGYAWVDNEVKGIRDIFDMRDDVILRIEFMDTKVINDQQHYEMLADIYMRKYDSLKFDVIISTDDDALKFLRKYRDKLFPGVPLVFAGVNNYTAAKTAGMKNFTGVNEAADLTQSLKLIGELLPEVTEIIVINDDLTTGIALEEEFKLAATQFESKYKFDYLPDLSMEDLKKRLSLLSEKQAVFYLSFFRDANGIHYSPTESLPQISQASSVPVFGVVDYMLGKGIVGGLLKSSFFQGQTAARLALEILAGKSTLELPVILQSPLVYGFDYLQLQRFDLPLRLLPQGSQLVNEPESFYYRNKVYIWSSLAIFTLLVIYIITLLINIRQRVRVQKGLQNVLSASQTIFDTSVLPQFKQDLKSNLEYVLPQAREITLLHLSNMKNGFKSQNLAVVESGNNTVINVEEIEMISQAVSSQSSLFVKDQAIVLLEGDNSPVNIVSIKARKKLDNIDRQLLELFTGNLALSIENAETFKLSASLQTAQRIQNAMLPTNFDVVNEAFNIDLNAFIVPAKEVGGDLYDFFSLDEDNLCVLVGDVSGKGVPAAIFMAMAKTILRSTADSSLSPAEILYRANNTLSRDNTESMFVTIFLAIYNKNSGKLRYADGGHNAPYLINSTGEVVPIEAKKGIALGVMEDMPFHTGELKLSPGDALFIYTDGVTEAANPSEALYLEPRLESCLQQNFWLNAKDFNRVLLKDVQRFVNNAQQSDDITSLFLRRNITSLLIDK